MPTFRRILGPLSVALVLTGLGPGPVRAGSASFSTAFLDSLGNPLGSQNFAIGNSGAYEVLDFSGTSSTPIGNLPSLQSLGSMSVTGLSGSGQDLVTSVPFILRISQSDSGGTLSTGDITGSLNVVGDVTVNLPIIGLTTFDTFSVTFNQTSVSVGNINYQLGHPNQNPFAPYTVNGGLYTDDQPGVLLKSFVINAQASDPPLSAVPEPSTLALSGVALAVLGLTRTARRRRKSA